MPGLAGNRSLKGIRCNVRTFAHFAKTWRKVQGLSSAALRQRFDDVTREPLTSSHHDSRHADICGFAHPCERDWELAETALTRYYPDAPRYRAPASDPYGQRQDSWSRPRKSSPPPLPRCQRELSTEPPPTSKTSVYPIDNANLPSQQSTSASSVATAQDSTTKPSTTSNPITNPESVVQSRQNSLSKFFDIDPSRIKDTLSKGDSKSKWKPVGSSSGSRKSTTGTSNAGNTQKNTSSTLNSPLAESGGKPHSKLSYVDEKQVARGDRQSSARFIDILQQLANLIIARRDIAIQSRDMGDLILPSSTGTAEADPDTGQIYNADHRLRDYVTDIDELLVELLDPAEVAAPEDMDSLALSLKELLAPTSSQRFVNARDAELFIQTYNEMVILGVSGPLTNLQGKLKKSIEAVTERQGATGAQQHEHLEAWSKTVQQELDVAESAHLQEKSVLETSLLSMHSAATQASIESRGKLARIAELDNEFDLLQQDREVLVKRLNTIEAAHAEIQETAQAFCPSTGSGDGRTARNPLQPDEAASFRNHLLACIQPEIGQAQIRGWDEILRLQHEHTSGQMNTLLKDLRIVMERSNILSTLATKWIRSQINGPA